MENKHWAAGYEGQKNQFTPQQAANFIEDFEMRCADCEEPIMVQRLEEQPSVLRIYFIPHQCKIPM